MINLHFIMYIILALILIHFILYFFNLDIFELFDKKKNNKLNDVKLIENSDMINNNINELENSLEELKEITSN